MPAEVLEIGPGAGMLLQELAAQGTKCHALETSDAARELVRNICLASGHQIAIHASAQTDWTGRFPLLLAMEVLEHIEDDAAALSQWRDWLKPGGHLLMSVPAHPVLWNAADVWAGHYRRYQRRGLCKRIEDAGLELVHVECIGFPLGNLTEMMQARTVAQQFRQHGHEGERQRNNDRSGIERDGLLKWYPRLKSPIGRLALRGAFAMQALASQLPLGNGYLVLARKPE